MLLRGKSGISNHLKKVGRLVVYPSMLQDGVASTSKRSSKSQHVPSIYSLVRLEVGIPMSSKKTLFQSNTQNTKHNCGIKFFKFAK